MKVTITPTPLAGTITPPPSKSQAHRLLIAAALGGGVSRIANVARSQDIAATLSCLEALGAAVEQEGEDTLAVRGLGGARPRGGTLPRFDCGESGSTLRFLIPIALAAAEGGVFTGRGRLMERPQAPYFAIFREKGIAYALEDGVLTVQGRLTPGTYTLPGDVSSQFITGLLYALPLLDGDSAIRLTTPLESRGYVDMTLDALEQFGVRAAYDGDRLFRVPGGQRYQSRAVAVEADWSNAAFWYAACFAGCPLELEGLNERSTQGDMRIVPYFLKLQGEGDLDLDVSQCPDLVPPLAAMAALRAGRTTRIVNAARLRIKESDRLATVTQVLSQLGADIREGADSLTIRGRDTLAGGVTVSGCNDHRIAMMAAVAAIRCRGPVTITGAQCVQKSYPNFWDDYEKLGGHLTREDHI